MRKSIRVDRFPFACRIFVDSRVVSGSDRLSKTDVRCPITIRHETRERASLKPVRPSLVTLIVWRPVTLLNCLTILLSGRTMFLNFLASLLSFPAALLSRLTCLVLSCPTSLFSFPATLLSRLTCLVLSCPASLLVFPAALLNRLTCLLSCPASLLVFFAVLISRRFTCLLSCPTSLLSRLAAFLSCLAIRLIPPNIKRSVPGEICVVICDFKTINPRSIAWIFL